MDYSVTFSVIHFDFVAISVLSYQLLQRLITGACAHCFDLKCILLYIVLYIMASEPPPDNQHVRDLDQPGDVCFQRSFVDQVKKARDSVFDEICEKTGVPEYTDIRCAHLVAKRSVTKDTLASWLETVCYVLDQFAVPWLEKAAPLVKELADLKNDKIADQETIINLQAKVIEKQEERLDSVRHAVQSTVETEMKSYASAVSKSCSNALTPKRIHNVVRKVAVKEETMKNVIVYGLSETEGEDVEGRVNEVLSELGEKPVVRDCIRLGLRKENTVRPIKFAVGSSNHAAQVIRNARLLRTKEGYSSVYICPDRTLEERRAYKQLVDQMKMKRIAEPDKVFVIKNNKIVCSVRSEPGTAGAP